MGKDLLDHMKEVEVKPWASEFDVVHQDWVFRLIRFRGERRHKTPVLIAYAFINRPYVLDLRKEVSVVGKFVEAGLDVWMIDWGYPKRADRYLRISDYVEYMDRCVELIKEKTGCDKVTLHGYCLGATLAAIYAAIHGRNVRNLVLQAPALNFETRNTLAVWARNINPGKVVRTLGNATGDFLNIAFLLVDPARLVLEKYQSLIGNIDNRKFLTNFLYMDHWIFDSPDIPGEVYREYIERWYQKNEIMKGEFDVNGEKVDLAKITMPLLMLIADKDHITPPESAIPFYEAVPSRDKLLLRLEKGHIGLSVSSSAHKTLWKKAVEWIVERSN